MESSDILILIGVIIAALPGLLALRHQKRKVDSEVWDRAMQASRELMDDLRGDLDKERARVLRHEKTILNLKGNYEEVQNTLTLAMKKIEVLEDEKTSLQRTNEELTRQLSRGIDNLLERQNM